MAETLEEDVKYLIDRYGLESVLFAAEKVCKQKVRLFENAGDGIDYTEPWRGAGYHVQKAWVGVHALNLL